MSMLILPMRMALTRFRIFSKQTSFFSSSEPKAQHKDEVQQTRLECNKELEEFEVFATVSPNFLVRI